MIDSHLSGPARQALVAALAAACCAAAASAQTTTGTASISVAPISFGRSECVSGNDVTVSWSFSSFTTGNETVDVVVTTDPGCAATTGAPKPTPVAGRTGNFTLKPTDFILGADGGCDSDVRSSKPGTDYICVRRLLNGTVQETLTATVTYAFTAPAAPTQPSGRPGDHHVRLTWAQGDPSEKIANYGIFAKPAAGTPAEGLESDGGTDDGGTPAIPGDSVFSSSDLVEDKVADTTVDVGSVPDGGALQNDVKYVFAVRANDNFGNQSVLSNVQVASPLLIDDFYGHYRDEGGGDLGGRGCGSLGTAGWLVAIACLVLLWRRGKRSGAALAWLLAASAGPARAETLEERLLRVTQRPARKLLVALKIDRYDPQIDTAASLGANHPYLDIFHGRAPLRWQLEADWQVAHPFGSLLIGGTVGYWQNVGRGWNPTGGPDKTGAPSEDTALLDIAPFGLIATYRFDWAADRLNVPIIPYAQVGLQAAFWASRNGRGDVVSTRGGRASGWVTGTTTALGVALALDWIDPGLSREAYNDVGIQRASLFAEYGWTNLTSFGKASSLVLSDRAWRFGLALEF